MSAEAATELEPRLNRGNRGRQVRTSKSIGLLHLSSLVAAAVVLLAVPPMIEGSTNPAGATTAKPHASNSSCAQNGDFPYASSVVGIAATHDDGGYWIADNTGAVAACGDAPNLGQTGALNRPIVGIAATPDGGGFYLVASDGGVFAFGDAQFHGSTGNLTLNKPIVGMAVDAATGGYWLVASDGGVFAFDAPFLGSTGAMSLNKPVVGMAVANNGSGYWLVASDGGIFAFNAPFWGSTGSLVLNKPVVGMAVDLATSGYWLVASDGGIFSFNSPFDGSTGNITLNEPIVGMESNATGSGYRFIAADGGVFDFGTSGFDGTPIFAPPPPPPAPPPPPPATPGPGATFSCTGSTPVGVDITYGTDSSNYSGASTVPWQATLPFDSNALYYDVTAQLNGSGSVTCTTTVKWSGGSVTQTGTAVGDYNILIAEICSNFSGGWQPC